MSRPRWTVFALGLGMTAALVAAAPPATAAGVWDPNDTEGRLDIRWVGLRFTSGEKARLTLVMYPNFRRKALPTSDGGRGRLAVSVDEFTDGIFFRRNGRIKVSYGDHGSGCCEVVTVHRPGRTTLVATIHPYPWGDLGEPGAPVFGESSFRRKDGVHRDRTASFRFPPPG